MLLKIYTNIYIYYYIYILLYTGSQFSGGDPWAHNTVMSRTFGHQICGWSFANFPRARLDSDMVFFWGNVLFAIPKFKIIQRVTVIDGYRLLSLIEVELWVYTSCWLYMYWHVHFYIYIWLVVSTPLKNISQLGWLFPTYGKLQNVLNHQPDINDTNDFHCGCFMPPFRDPQNDTAQETPQQSPRECWPFAARCWQRPGNWFVTKSDKGKVIWVIYSVF